jgi:peptide/nickel transport system permease protein
MTEYALRRLLALIPTVLGASMIIFFTLRLFAPVDIIEETLLESPGASDPIVRERLRAEFGLDKPIYEQYVQWIWGAVRGDLGTSWSSGRPVMTQITESLPVSLELTVINLLLAVIIGVPIGVISAVNQNSWSDYGGRFFAIFGLSVPSFVIATVLLLTPAMVWGWAPPLGYASPFEDLQIHALQMFLPVFSLSFSVAATKVRMLRSTMLEVLRMDYVRTARAKGLEQRVVILRHALKNALIPVVTILGVQVSYSLGGSVVIEQIYSLPGLGRLTLASIQRGDFPQLQANVLYLLIIFLVFNLIVDISYAWLDPRIRYQ